MMGGLGSLLGLRGKRMSASRVAAAVLEALETRALLAATLSPEGALLVAGTEAADAIVVRVNAAGTDVQVQGAGTGIALFRLTAVQSVQVQGGGGDDSLTLDAAGGLLGHAGAALPIRYEGGAGSDTLALTGAPAGVSVSETITPGPGAGAGRVSSQGGQVTQSVEFSGIESLLDTSAAASLTINLGDGGNLVEVAGGTAVDGAATGTIKAFEVTLCDVPAPMTASVAATSSAVMAGGEGDSAAPATPTVDGPGNHGRGKAKGHLKQKQKQKKPKKLHGRKAREAAATAAAQTAAADTVAAVQVSAAAEPTAAAVVAAPQQALLIGVAYAPVQFANKAQITINTAGGDDWVAVDLPTPATGLKSLTVNTGDGQDRIAEIATPAGVAWAKQGAEDVAPTRGFVGVTECPAPPVSPPPPPPPPPTPGPVTNPPPPPAPSPDDQGADNDNNHDGDGGGADDDKGEKDAKHKKAKKAKKAKNKEHKHGSDDNGSNDDDNRAGGSEHGKGKKARGKAKRRH